MRGRNLQRSRVRNMSDVERAYIGMAIDTDGSVVVEQPYRPAWTAHWRIRFDNTDVELISAVLRAVGAGSVSYKPASEGLIRRHRDQWVWRLNRQKEVLDLAQQCAAYSVKLQRVLANPWEPK